ncbi:MAG: phosphatidylinositol mannoside acyltransferase [Jatrophihabitantaceae bacterium]
MFERARASAVDLGYAAGWSVVKSAPAGMSARAFRAVADAAVVRNGGGIRQLRKNLRRVVGPSVSELRMDQIVGDAMRSYSRYWLETFRLPKLDLRAVATETDANMTGQGTLTAAIEAGKGAVLALPHSGNWDVAGVWLVDQHGPFTTVAERLKPDSLFDRFVAFRESLGMEVIALTGGQRPPVDVLSERLRAGGVVCLLADRDLSRNGIAVDFFGEPTRMPGGPALLAATTGAALLPVHCWYQGDSWGMSVHSAVQLPDAGLRDQVAAGTQALADTFATNIAEHPADWHMLQRLWLADLPPRLGKQPEPA